MNETIVTVQGYVGTVPESREVGDTEVTSFRVASTPRTFSQKDGWADRETNWYTVNAWRGLARHCMSSLHQGEPVIVHGRLRTQVWQDSSGANRTTMVIEATSVGHDLTRGTSAFLKDSRGALEPTVEEQQLAEDNAALDVAGPQMTSDGRFLTEPAQVAPF